MDGNVVSTERTIDAPPDAIFALLADASRHPDIDGSGTVKKAKEESRRLGLGDTFGMSMHQGIGYSMVNTVIEFEENRRIAWQSTISGLPGPVHRRTDLAVRARAGRRRHPGAGELGHQPGPSTAVPQASGKLADDDQVQHGQDPGPHRGADRRRHPTGA